MCIMHTVKKYRIIIFTIFFVALVGISSFLIYITKKNTSIASQSTLIKLSSDQTWIKNYKTPIITIFAHGFGDSMKQAKPYKNRNYFITDYLYMFNFTDATNYTKKYRTPPLMHALLFANIKKSSIGQVSDIQILTKAIEKMHTLYPQGKIILYGVSRGAATIINTVAILAMEGNTELLNTIIGIVAESPFASSEDVLTTFLPIIPIQLKKIMFSLLCPYHNLDGHQPVNLISHIPHNIPLLFVLSLLDTCVYPNSTYRLYEQIKKNRPKHTITKLTVINHGTHANLFCESYKQEVHEFLQEILNSSTLKLK